MSAESRCNALRSAPDPLDSVRRRIRATWFAGTSLVVVCVTGILITSFKFWGIELVEGLHEVSANWVLISVGLHLAGVAFDTWHSKVNLVRAMITGQKEIPGREE